MAETTTIQASTELVDELYDRKQRGETYEDVIWRLIETVADFERHTSYPAPSQRTTPAEEEPADPVPESASPSLFDLTPEIKDAIPGSGARHEARAETLREMVAMLHVEGMAEKSDFLELVDPDEVGFSDEASFWSNCVKGKDTLSAHPHVQKPDTGLTEWYWVE